jgi:hypothetical protein
MKTTLNPTFPNKGHQMETTNFPLAVYKNTTEVYWYLYNLEELINFLNEHDEFFTYKAIKE